jgi:hypothetical protein
MFANGFAELCSPCWFETSFDAKVSGVFELGLKLALSGLEQGTPPGHGLAASSDSVPGIGNLFCNEERLFRSGDLDSFAPLQRLPGDA